MASQHPESSADMIGSATGLNLANQRMTVTVHVHVRQDVDLEVGPQGIHVDFLEFDRGYMMKNCPESIGCPVLRHLRGINYFHLNLL
jgi:hypothetical protein